VLVQLAVALTWYGPYITGLVQLVLIGLFPFVLLWALIPGTHFEPLAHYFVALLFTSSTPLWWALVDQAARIAATQVPQMGHGWDAAIAAWMLQGLWTATIAALGVFIIPLIVGSLFFVAFRGVHTLWRGAL